MSPKGTHGRCAGAAQAVRPQAGRPGGSGAVGAAGATLATTATPAAAVTDTFDGNIVVRGSSSNATASEIGDGVNARTGAAGAMQLRWAQDEAHSSTLTIESDSYLQLTRVG